MRVILFQCKILFIILRILRHIWIQMYTIYYIHYTCIHIHVHVHVPILYMYMYRYSVLIHVPHVKYMFSQPLSGLYTEGKNPGISPSANRTCSYLANYSLLQCCVNNNSSHLEHHPHLLPRHCTFLMNSAKAPSASISSAYDPTSDIRPPLMTKIWSHCGR